MVLLAPVAILVLVVKMVQLELLVLLDPRVPMDNLVSRVNLESQGRREMLGLLDPKDLQDHLALMVLMVFLD